MKTKYGAVTPPLPVFHHWHDFSVEGVQAFQALAGFVTPCKLLIKSAVVDEYLPVSLLVYGIYKSWPKKYCKSRGHRLEVVLLMTFGIGLDG